MLLKLRFSLFEIISILSFCAIAGCATQPAIFSADELATRKLEPEGGLPPGLRFDSHAVMGFLPNSWGEGPLYDTLVISPNMLRTAYITRLDDLAAMVVDGKIGNYYHGISKDSAYFSPDSKHVSFAVSDGKSWLMVTDGKENQPYSVVYRGFAFHPGSSDPVYVAGNGGKRFLIVDGMPRKSYDAIVPPIHDLPQLNSEFFKDMATAFLGGYTTPNPSRAHREAVIGYLLDSGYKYAKYVEVGEPVKFMNNGDHLVYVAKDKGKAFVVLDEQEQKVFDDIVYLAVAPSTGRIAYCARQGKEWLLVADGKEVRIADVREKGEMPYGTMTLLESFGKETKQPVFSPDGKRLAYVVREQDGFSVTVDGVRGKTYADVNTITFSPDGAHIAYSAKVKDGWIVVADGAEGGTYNQTGAIIFSPDSSRLAYTARRFMMSRAVVDGKEMSEITFDKDRTEYPLGIGGMFFSPDSKRFAYSSRNIFGRWSAVIDGKKEKESYGDMGPIIFDQTSKHYAYFARGISGWFLVVNGHEVAVCDSILPEGAAKMEDTLLGPTGNLMAGSSYFAASCVKGRLVFTVRAELSATQ